MNKMSLIILTKSSKLGDYCVAGIEINTKKWVRLVRDNGNDNGAIPNGYMRTSDGESVNVLDMIEVVYLRHSPQKYQSENYVVDLSVKPRIIRKGLPLEDVIKMHPLDKPYRLYAGTLPYATDNYLDFDRINYSLLLIKVKDIMFYKTENKKSKIEFKYKGIIYRDISMTDPDYYDDRYYNGHYYSEAVIVLSLGERFENTDKHYKFAARIFLSQEFRK